jgi:hypothetical protein
MGKLIQDIVLIISGGAKYSASLYLEASGLCTMAVSISDETGTYLSMDTPSVPNSSEMLFESLVISVQKYIKSRSRHQFIEFVQNEGGTPILSIAQQDVILQRLGVRAHATINY